MSGKPPRDRRGTTDKGEKPKIVTLCGSSRFVEIMAVCAWMIERDEHAIAMGLHLLPEWYCREEIPDHLAEHEGCAEAMDRLHLAKIDISDEIFVVNVQHYVGDSTRREVEYAMDKGKKIRWFTDDIIGRPTKPRPEKPPHGTNPVDAAEKLRRGSSDARSTVEQFKREAVQ